MASRRRRTTASSSRDALGRFRSGLRPANYSGSKVPEQKGHRFGAWELLSRKVEFRKDYRYVKVRCQCGRVMCRSLDNLRAGKSTQCQRCLGKKARTPWPQWLARRLTAAKLRCTHPQSPGWRNYGGRGIEFRFDSVTAAADWVWRNLGADDKTKEIDRIDNNGHYEAGNLRWATRSEQQCNRRGVIIGAFNPHEWPYCRSRVTKYAKQGMDRAQILQQAKKAVKEKRKGWRRIAAWFESMTS